MDVLPSLPHQYSISFHNHRNSLPISPSFLNKSSTNDVALAYAIAAAVPCSPAADLTPSRRRSSPSTITPTQATYRSKAAFAPATILINEQYPTGDPRVSLSPLDLTNNATIDRRKLSLPRALVQADMSQDGRISSATLTNATRPTPYIQRNLPRRPPPSQRRPSLPALRQSDQQQSDRERDRSRPLPPPPLAPHQHVTSTSASNLAEIAPFEFANPPPPSTDGTFVPGRMTYEEEADIYSRLSTFTFGDAQSPSQVHSSSQHHHLGGPTASSSSTKIEEEFVSPLDRTPRPSISHMRGVNGRTPKENGWSSSSEDEEARRRTNNRSKMRAVDDGSRRPSLPSASSSQVPSQAESAKAKGKAKDTDTSATAISPSLSSPSSVSITDDALDTDVDLVSADDVDRRRRPAHYEYGSSTASYGFEFDFDGTTRQSEGRYSNEQELGREADDKERKDSTMTVKDGRRGSLAVNIPYSATSNSARSGPQTKMDIQAIAPWDDPSDFQASSKEKNDDDREVFDPQSLVQLRRPSRSMDDDLSLSLSAYAHRRASRASAHSHGSHHEHSGGLGMAPSSEPDMRGVAMAQALVQAHINAHAQAQQQQPSQQRSQSIHTLGVSVDPLASVPPESTGTSGSSPDGECNAYEGLDLNYILSGSQFGPGGAGGKEGGREGNTGGSDAWSGRLSISSSIIGPAARERLAGSAGADGRQREPSWVAGWGLGGLGAGLGLVGGRRQSTATVNDDTFLRFVKKHDFSYDERKREWTFARETKETSAMDPGVMPGTSMSASIHGHEPKPNQEIWRCLWVGRYRVDKVNSKNADPSKPPQIRLNVRHLPDPYSKTGSQTAAGPLTFIHKHSRAQAFSIFRGHSLPQRHLKTSSSILLAPKKVQEQFTSTRTTSKLSTHGLLEDKEGERRSSEKEKERERMKREREREREKARERDREREGKSATSSSGTVVANSSSTSQTSMSSQGHNKTPSAEPGNLRLRIEGSSSSDRNKNGRSSGPSKSPESPSGGVTPNSGRPSMNITKPNDSSNRSTSKDKVSSPSDADTPISRSYKSPFPSALEQEVRQKAKAPLPKDDLRLPAHLNGDQDNVERESRKRPESSVWGSRASVFSEGSQQFSSAISAFDQSSIASSFNSRPPLSAVSTTAQSIARGSVGSLDEQPIKTSHAEAFAALEPPYIEYLRMHGSHYDGDGHDSSTSRFRGLRKLFHPQPAKVGGKHSPLSGSGSSLVPGAGGGGGAAGVAAVLEGHYTPPWLTMAARSKQEEQERVIKNLNDSFRDVGLLPSFKPNKNNRKEKKKKGSENVFDQIPDDALYMLLPMWPGETDRQSAMADRETNWGVPDDWEVPLEERQYLLVYYVANDLSKKSEENTKKRARGGGSAQHASGRGHSSQTASHGSASSTHSDPNSRPSTLVGSVEAKAAARTAVSLSSFNVLARLVSYRDIHGSGIRIPTQGLSVTGPLSAARNAIPKISFRTDDLALMIAFCPSRERGVEVVPEGAEKLGLCMPRDGALRENLDLDAPLSSLGRAAVEMAWLGALAVMGFGSVA